MSFRKCLGLLGVVIMIAAAVHAGGQMASIQVKNGQLRASPTFLGRIVASESYGSRVEVLQQQGAWAQVRDDRGHTGWIHQSALTEKKIVLRAGDRDVATGTSSEDLALAGKGFNSEVEAEFMAQNKDIDFKWVDWMETLVVSPQESVAFLQEGNVQAVQGGGE